MKKAIAIINPVLVYVKYLLFAASLFLGLLSIAQFLKLDIEFSGGVIQTMLPFLGAAGISMYFTKRIKIKRR